jgi:hypothetical protein
MLLPSLVFLLFMNEKRQKNPASKNSTWNAHVNRVLGEVHPGHGISSESKLFMNRFINTIGKRIVDKTIALGKKTADKTSTPEEIINAVQHVMHDEHGLKTHSISELKKRLKDPSYVELSLVNAKQLFMNSNNTLVLHNDTHIALTAVLVYLTAEILDLAGSVAESESLPFISPTHIKIAIKNDPEFKSLFKKLKL